MAATAWRTPHPSDDSWRVRLTECDGTPCVFSVVVSKLQVAEGYWAARGLFALFGLVLGCTPRGVARWVPTLRLRAELSERAFLPGQAPSGEAGAAQNSQRRWRVSATLRFREPFRAPPQPPFVSETKGWPPAGIPCRVAAACRWEAAAREAAFERAYAEPASHAARTTRRRRGGGPALALALAAWAQAALALGQADGERDARPAEAPSADQVVRAALRHRQADPAEVRDAIDRARLSGALPTARFAVRRGQAVDLRGLYASEGLRTNVTTGDDLTLEATLSFRLDRLAFAGEETVLLRELRARETAQREAVRELLHLYFERRRLQIEQALVPSTGLAPRLRILELEAYLDYLTGGFFGRRTATENRLSGLDPLEHGARSAVGDEACDAHRRGVTEDGRGLRVRVDTSASDRSRPLRPGVAVVRGGSVERPPEVASDPQRPSLSAISREAGGSAETARSVDARRDRGALAGRSADGG